MLKYVVATVLFSLSAGSAAECVPHVAGQALPAGPLKIAKIEFVRNDIFDLTAKNTLWFHRFANEYHVVTTEGTLRDDLLFSEGDTLDPAELAETERLLRARRYLRHAEVEVSQYCAETASVVVTVTSWDNWSLLPKIDLGHEGGETKSASGFAEDNLLGSGNQLQAEYYNDSERDGFQLRSVSPNIFGNHWRTSMFYADNSDGESYLLNLEKPFYRLNSERAYGFTIAKNIKDLTEYWLGDEVNEYQSKAQFLRSAYRLENQSKARYGPAFAGRSDVGRASVQQQRAIILAGASRSRFITDLAGLGISTIGLSETTKLFFVQPHRRY